MVELPEAWKAIVNALLRAAVAWQTPAKIAEALGRDVEETTDLLCLMDEAGWITVWDADPEPFILFSALAAERLHVHLVEVGPNETPRWARAGDPIPPRPRARNVIRSEQAAALGHVPDPLPSPDEAAERSERAEVLGRIGRWPVAGGRSESSKNRPSPSSTGHRPPATGQSPGLPFPTLLRGQALTPWPGPIGFRKSPCPACGDLPLRPHEYCLGCDRWGLDALLPPVPPPPTRRPYFPPLVPPDGARTERQTRQEPSSAGLERLRRKAKRKAKRASKSEAARFRNPQAEIRAEKRPSAVESVPAQDEGPKPASDKARS